MLSFLFFLPALPGSAPSTDCIATATAATQASEIHSLLQKSLSLSLTRETSEMDQAIQIVWVILLFCSPPYFVFSCCFIPLKTA